MYWIFIYKNVFLFQADWGNEMAWWTVSGNMSLVIGKEAD